MRGQAGVRAQETRRALTVVALSRWIVASLLQAALAAALAAPVDAQNARGLEPQDLKKLSFEELMDLEVTTLSRKEERVNRAAAAVYVITGEEIRRSGASSIPEALRLAPGVEVARVNAQNWAISIRGFNGETANKLLVLIDGRSVYTPLFSGVFWDAQDVLLEHVDRIEVIAGPGGALWGANAVNGVINIITKGAADTQGGYVEAGGGDEQQFLGATSYGGRLGNGAWMRGYAKRFEVGPSARAGGGEATDDWRRAQGGFRLDHVRDGDTLTLQSDLYDGETAGATNLSGGNLLGRWSRRLGGSGDLQVQAYYDRTKRAIPSAFTEERDTLDLDLQHRLASRGRHDVIWGLGYRVTEDEVDNSTFISFRPESRRDELASAFFQDEITLLGDRLYLTLGSKFEHNDYTGFEAQPSARLAYYPSERQTLWAAVSRAVRTPSRLDSDLVLSATVAIPEIPVPVVIEVRGDEDFDSEELIAWEAGYRIEISETLFLDLAAFYNEYDELQSQEPETPVFVPDPLSPHILLPNRLANGLEGETLGGSVLANWAPREGWRLEMSYSHLEFDLRNVAGSLDPSTAGSLAGSSPEHMASLHSYLDLTSDAELFLGIRYVDDLPVQGVESYVGLDLRVAWRPRPALGISVTGRDLLDDEHSEFSSGNMLRIERSVLGRVSWRF